MSTVQPSNSYFGQNYRTDTNTGMNPDSWQARGLDHVVNLMMQAEQNGQTYKPKPEDFYHALNQDYDKAHTFTQVVADACVKTVAAAFGVFWGSAKAEVIKESVAYAKNNMKGNGEGFFFEKFEKEYPHLVDQQGMRRFKDLVAIGSNLAVKGAVDCASKTNAECMSIDIDAYILLKANSIEDAAKFYIECLKHDTPQCGWADETIFSEIALIKPDTAGKIAQQCASINSNGCSKIDIMAFDTLVEKDPSEALIFAQECADKDTVQCSTLGKDAHDKLATKSDSKAKALKKKCENLTTPQCVEMRV